MPEDLEAGRYRVVDMLSGMGSEPLEIDTTAGVHRIRLDLSGAHWIEGRITTPDPADAAQASVEATIEDDPRAGLASTDWRHHVVDRRGRFRVRAPSGPVRLSAAHPVLRPDAESQDRVVLSGPVELRLVAAGRATVQLDRPGPEILYRRLDGAEVLLYEGDPGPDPKARLPLVREGDLHVFAGFEPGIWTLCIMTPHYAPLILGGVRLGPGETDLGRHALGRGSQIIVSQPKDGEPVQASVRLQSLDAPPVDQRGALNRGWESILLGGLGPGRYRLTINGRAREVTLDGVEDITVHVSR
jgi:hypothetical protein